MSNFAAVVVRWQKKHGRHDLPWQRDADPYKVWLSEIMLQQTQVAAVIPYYERFLQRFPTLAALARARTSSVLAAWSGLGYYARARHLHAAAKLMHKHGIPQDIDGWCALPGVGRSTAAAVMVFSHGKRHAILDGNVKRVLARTHLFSAPINTPAAETALWQLAESLLPPASGIRPYTQGLMDIGATLCRRRQPLCGDCPLAGRCVAHRQGVAAEYPKRRQKAPKPERTAHFLLIRCAGDVLLQQQPPRGIWGGLWSLPRADGGVNGDKGGENSEISGININALTPAGQRTFTHEFTHYRLHATVSLYNHASAAAKPTVAKPLRWHSKLGNIGLPAPMRTLLEREMPAVDLQSKLK